MSRLLGAAGLGVLYVLTLASSDPVDLATGMLLGLVLASLLGRRMRPPEAPVTPSLIRRSVWFGVFAAAVLGDVIDGAWDVTLRVMHLRPVERPGCLLYTSPSPRD